MKRGKDDEKVMGPMFPRLHVNDTEKGGPRAPPRNKMALYEQLSIPSQRFKPGVVPTPPNNTANPASSSQTKHSEEDDFRVPIFMQSHVGQGRGKPFLSSPANTERPTKHLTNSNIEPRQTIAIGCNTRQEDRNQNNEEVREFIGAREQSVKAVANSLSVSASRQGDASISHILTACTANNSSWLHEADEPLPSEHRANTPINGRVLRDAVFTDTTRLRSNEDSVPIYDFHSEEQRILDDSESFEDRTPLPTAVADRDDGASETSMVDSISGLDISPDDVVGIIGQKHFWKARRAIVNQQRVFAVQVFELHRLIKVQRMIAGSPHLLLADSAYLGKPIKGSPPKKLPIEYAVKGVSNGSNLKNDSEKPNHKIEFSAENTVGKASLSSVQNGSQLPGYKPLSVNSPAAGAGDHTTSPWCFHQPQGHQWLIPVMSPSEGLVYKPYPGPGYPGPGFMAPACGGCGPPGSTPMMGNFFPPSYGVPATHHFQGMGVPPFAPPTGPQGYFPPYGMSVLNQGITGSVVGPMNQFAASGLHDQQPQLGANNIIQHQNSSNVPSQKKGSVVDARKSQVSQDGDLQISAASTPSERLQGSGRTNTTDGSSVLPLFPTSPHVEAPSHHNAPPPSEVDHSARVIKVVPHNGRLATESVARIFQSIQEERKHNDSV